MTAKTVVEELPFREAALASFVEGLRHPDADDEALTRAKHLLDFPTVYVVHQGPPGQYSVYVGETSDIRSRTTQHLKADILHREDWKGLANDTTASMFVIGDERFNKSLTLDIENRLMLWLGGVDVVERLHNRRTNAQNDYYSREHLDEVFKQAWSLLGERNPDLFPAVEKVRESALFKASPFHELTKPQLDAKAEILAAIHEARQSRGSRQPNPEAMGTLILVEGAAGSGKTVLMSNLFYDLFMEDVARDVTLNQGDLDAYLLVNHDEQLTVYQQIAKKLGLLRKGKQRVSKPTSFINGRERGNKAEVILIDEAHLLWTQGKQSYQGKNMLVDLLERGHVVVAIFDPMQVLATNQYWEEDALAALRAQASRVIQLKEQLRMKSSLETIRWLQLMIREREVTPIPADDSYEIRVFDSAAALRDAIRHKVQKGHGLSRITATFDWPFSSVRTSPTGTWDVTVDTFRMPWNRQTVYELAEHRHVRGLSWAERPRSLDEVGSHFTVQGFDLDYAGVIIGPSVKYRNGQIVFDPTASANKHATQKRTLANGEKRSVAEDLLRNELNVLLTRGAKGLYLYAVDDELQRALLKAQAATS